jgi:hypothetical protein
MFDSGAEKHIETYWIEFKTRSISEACALESVNKPPKGLVEFKKHL